MMVEDIPGEVPNTSEPKVFSIEYPRRILEPPQKQFLFVT
jgi:hypothetical protein